MTKKIQNAKTKLLELGFIDNEWLEKYLELVKLNCTNRRITGKTQEHHAIPVNSYWTSIKPYKRAEALKLAESDKNNFKIHLLYKDHLLAHSYLTLCTNLDCIQARYEAQADLRKHNSAVGVAAANKVLANNCCNNVIQIEHNRAASVINLNKYYSASDVEEIMNL
jgi:hypothetical protein